MGNQEKKMRERHFLEAFLKHSNQTFENIVDHEGPDFILERDGIRLGVEVTLVYRDEGPVGSLLKKNESQSEGFLQRLADAYYLSGGLPLSLMTNFSAWPTTKDIPRLVEKLKANYPEVGAAEREVEVDDTGTYYLRALPDRFGDYKVWQCANVSVGWVGVLEKGSIESRIASKARKLSAYRRCVETNHLLIVINQMRGSGMVNLPDTLGKLDGCGFDEVHVFTYPHESRRVA